MNELLRAIDEALQVEDWFIALDRDGTIVPYANRPEEAVVTPELYDLISELCRRKGVRVAIISARSSAQLRGDFEGCGAILAGNYGMEVILADGTECIQPNALNAVPELKEARDDLSERVDLAGGSILEDHGYSLCLHWHNVPLEHRPEMHKAVLSVSDKFKSELKFRRLPTSYEVLPNINWDKGLGLEFIDSNIGKPKGTRMRFFGGDTEADSPGFEYVNGKGGISVRVGADGELLRARFNLSVPAQLHEVLAYISAGKSAKTTLSRGLH